VHRCLFLPRVVTPTATPDMVVVRIPTDSPDTYFEQTMTPQEAFAHGMALIADAQRAAAYREREDYLATLASSAGERRSKAIP
jgi:hypothetical protein